MGADFSLPTCLGRDCSGSDSASVRSKRIPAADTTGGDRPTSKGPYAPVKLVPSLATHGDSESEKPVAELLNADPLAGRDKWLGGVLGADGCVYGVPGHAKTVLQIDPQTDAVRTLGTPMDGKYKWLRGNLHPDGSIYCIPCHASTILRIDCTASPPVISEMGGPHPGKWKWHGGVLSPHDLCIYSIPQFAETVLKIDPQTQTTSEIGGPFPGASPTGKHKWYGGLLGGDGCIYGQRPGRNRRTTRWRVWRCMHPLPLLSCPVRCHLHRCTAMR